MLSILRYLTI